MASESSDAEVLMPALGRHFQLGTLYNAREDEIRSGNFYPSCIYLMHLCIIFIFTNHNLFDLTIAELH